MTAITPSLKAYISLNIIPLYDHFDKAHQREHVDMVIRQSMEIAEKLADVNLDMVFTIAAYHDTGLCEGREHHHEVSGRIIRDEEALREWFTEEEIEVMAEAAEDHRASAKQAPRTIYGKIVAEADRHIDPETIILRTIQYGQEHYPELDKEGHYRRMLDHLHEKYGRNGYLHLWFDDSPNAQKLEELRVWMEDEQKMREMFEKLYK